MNRCTSLAFVSSVALLSLGLLVGCSKAPSDDATAAPTSTNNANKSAATEAVTRAASNFLDAVIKGDTQRAGACLTPQAMQRIIASGKPFAPQGMENATFRVGEVRTPAVDKAFVHCVVTDNTGGKTQSEDMCCLMRFVENEWRVSGIAYWGPNQSGTMSDFETGQSVPIPGMQAAPGMQATPGLQAPPNTAGQPPVAPSQSPATQPPRVATEPNSANPF
jgi:hypothetical protein